MRGVAEAPSKAILTGEHFVVHGAWALAGALPRKVRVEVSSASAYRVRSDRFSGTDPPELRPISAVIDAIAHEYSADPRVSITVASDVPKGAGLGSSASVMVAAASAFAKLRGVTLGVEEIVRVSMAGETEIHGRPSGIDPTICAHGGVLLFKPGSKPRRVRPKGRFSAIVSYSGESRSTKHQISRVGIVKEASPKYFESLSEAVSGLSLRAAADLSSGDWEDLGRLLTLNHAVLSSLGVSNPSLDRLVELANSLGALGAKLTGAGGGGSVLAIAPRGKEKRIVSGLRARGYETFNARLPVDGVRSWLER